MESLRPTRETYRESVKRQGGLRELGEEKEEKMKKGGKEKRQRKGNSTPLWKEMTCSGHLGSGDEGQVLLTLATFQSTTLPDLTGMEKEVTNHHLPTPTPAYYRSHILLPTNSS